MSNDNRAAGHNLDTSEGARAYVAEYFANQVGRHDFRAYITTRLAADFACALAQHLAARQPVGQEPVVISNEARECLQEIIDNCWHDEDQEVASEIDRLMRGPLYAAPPAQAVDLGHLPRAVELLSNVSRTLVDWAAEEQRKGIGIVKALIDSQAVRNG